MVLNKAAMKAMGYAQLEDALYAANLHFGLVSAKKEKWKKVEPNLCL